jgi:signal transduction histidine kinase
MADADRVILADDDPIMRELAEAKLREAGFIVLAVGDGAQALALLRKEGAGLVISDLEMPEMNGYELTENIRKDPAICETPIIVITASDQGEAVDRAFAAGASSFLAKPINWSLFNHAVKFVLRASNDQKALRAAKNQAEAGAKFKDSLLSVMSHELRTPLNAIIGFGQLIGEHFKEQENVLYKEYADYIVGGGKRLLNSVSDMLLASDARSGPIAISEVDTTVGDLIDGAVTAQMAVLGASEAEFDLRIQDRDLEIRCDRLLLSRAIAKLIDNSVKFSPNAVKVTIGAALTKKGELALLVKDNGPGLPTEKLKEMTTNFAQSDMSIRRSKEGLGLGLPLVRAIAKAHGASFMFDAVEGEGARALILLPASRVSQANARDRSKEVA